MSRCLICNTTFWRGARPGDSEPCDCGQNLTMSDLRQDETLSLKTLRESWQKQKDAA